MNDETVTETMPGPPGIRRECLEDPNLCKRFGSVVTAYDPKNQVGGFYYLGVTQWIVYFPITLDQFAERAARASRMVMEQEAALAQHPPH